MYVKINGYRGFRVDISTKSLIYPWIYPTVGYIHGYIQFDISKLDISMDISNIYICFGYIQNCYIHWYKRYIRIYPVHIYLFVDISKSIYLFVDIGNMDISGYIENGCIQKHISNTNICNKDISNTGTDIFKKDISNRIFLT